MLQALGRLHPLLVHFPIALLLAALVAEWLRPRAERPSEAGFFCLALGTLGAVAAALSGWLFAEHDPPGLPALLRLHRWSGFGAAATAVVTFVSAWRWKRGATAQLGRPTRLGLALTALFVGAAGTLGGEMVYGEGFVLEPLSEKPRKDAEVSGLLGAEIASLPNPSSSSPMPSPESPPRPSAASEPALEAERAPGTRPAVDYLSQIRPLFERRCFECHGERKRPKGNLRLSDLASVFAREHDEAVLVPGDPAASLLYRRLVLPAEHEDRMPPEDGPLPDEELELVRRWIEEGAHWSPLEPPGAARLEEPAASVVTLELSALQRTVRDAALERLRRRGARAQRSAHTSEEVEVDLGVALPIAGDDELALLAGLEPCLVELSLARCALSDQGLACLASFRSLRRLRLEHTSIGDAGLAHLAGLPALESLDLFDTSVTDAGLAALHGLARLARLYTGETDLSAAGLDELARARPGLTIERGRLPVFEADEPAPR